MGMGTHDIEGRRLGMLRRFYTVGQNRGSRNLGRHVTDGRHHWHTNCCGEHFLRLLNLYMSYWSLLLLKSIPIVHDGNGIMLSSNCMMRVLLFLLCLI